MTSPVRRRPPSTDLDAPPPAPVEVVLALGSNLGDRQATLRSAVDALASSPGLAVRAVSPVVESDPVGGPEQGPYLNAVVLARTTLSPRGVLGLCQRVESEHGRERRVRWGARTLDVDIVCYGTVLADSRDLVLPHPRAHERAFVLVPWALADPDAVLPGPDGGAVQRLSLAAADRGGVRQWVAP